MLINDEEEKKKRQEEFLNMVNTINDDDDFNFETYDNNVSFNNNISNQKEQEFFQMVNNLLLRLWYMAKFKCGTLSS